MSEAAEFKEYHRIEGGSVSCGYCNRTFTFNFMRDQGPHRCSCERAVAARAQATKNLRVDRVAAVFTKHLGPRPKKPTRKQIETTLDVLGWLSSGDQDPAVKDNISETRSLLDVLLEVGW